MSAVLRTEAHHLQGFFDVQIARAALRVAAVVIEDAIGKIRIFLNFAEHQSGPNGVRGAGRNENSFSPAQRNALQATFSRTILNRALEYFRRDVGFQAGQHFGPGPSLNRVPHFRLPTATRSFFVLRGEIVARMNLHR